jgi:hypothetical protein
MRLLRTTLIFVGFAAVAIAAQDQTRADYGTRARGAAQVVVAVVEDIQPRVDVNRYGDRLIISRTLLRVQETLKGTTESLVEMDLEGGTIGDLTLHVSDLPALRRGDRAVFFLTAAAANVRRPHERGLGIVKLDASDHAAGSASTLADIRAAVRAAH